MAYTSAEAQVLIVPSLRGFSEKVRAGVKATKVPPIQAQLQIDRKSLADAEREVRSASERIEKSRAAEVKSAESVRLAEAKLAEARKSSAAGSSTLIAAENRLQQAKRASVAASNSVAKATADEERALARVESLKARIATSEQKSRGLGGLVRGIDVKQIDGAERSMRRAMSSAASLGTSAFAAASAVTSIGAAAPAVLAIGSALATTAGAAFLLPSALGAAGVSFAALKVGMSGVKDAIDGDAEAMAKLAPQARAFVHEVQAISPAWAQVRSATQGALFAGLSTELGALSAQYLPAVRSALVQTASGWNAAALSVGQYLRSQAGISNVQAMLTNGANASGIFANALRPIVEMFTTIGAAGSSFLPGLATGFVNAANSANTFIQNAAKTGQLQQWIGNGLTALRQLWELLKNVGSIVLTVFSVANSVGGSTIQTVNQIVGAFRAWLQSAQGISFLTTIFTTIRDTVNSLRPGVEAVWGALVGLVQQVSPLLPQIGAAFSNIAIALAPVVGFLGSIVSVILPPFLWLVNMIAPALGFLAVTIGTVVAAIQIWRAVTTAFTVVQAILNAVMMANPIGLVVIALMALVAGVIYAWNNFDWFRNAVMGVWHFLQTLAGWIATAFVAAWNFLGTVVSNVWNWIKNTAVTVWNALVSFLMGGIAAFQAFWSAVWSGISGFFTGIWNWIKATAMSIWNGIVAYFQAAFAFYSALFSAVWNGILNVFRTVWNWLRDTAVSVWNGIVAFFTGAFAAFAGFFTNVWNGIVNTFRTVWNWLRDTAVNMWNGIWSFLKGAIDGFAGWFRDTWNGIVDGFRKVWDGLKAAAKAPIRFVLDVIWNQGVGGLWNAAKSVFPLGDFPNANGAIAALDRFATGGPVSGPGGPTADRIPALLSDGEHVLDAQDVKNLGGHRNVLALRSAAAQGMIPAFADGGPVGWQDLQRAVLGAFPNARITDTTRPGAHDFHGAGKAIDIAGPRSMDMPFMLNVNRWIASHFGNSAELIHTQPGAVNLKNGKPHAYSPAIQAGHRNHVHWANNGGRAGGFKGWLQGVGEGVMSFVQSLTDALANPEKWIRDQVARFFPSGPGDSLMKRFPMLATDWAIKTAKDFLFGKASEMDAAAGAGGIAAGGTGPVADQVRAVANRYGWGAGPQWDALVRLIQKESSWNPTNANPRSTAYGLFQFLNGTWGTVGGRKTANPREQAEYGLRYIKQKYRDPIGALAFHNANNWYHDGGLIPGVGDKLVLAEGGERVLNKTQTRVFEELVAQLPRTSGAVSAVARGVGLDRVSGSGGPTVTNWNNEFNVRETVDIDRALDRMYFLAGSP